MPSIQFRQTVVTGSNGAPLGNVVVVETDAGFRVLASNGTDGTSQYFDVDETSQTLLQTLAGPTDATNHSAPVLRQLEVGGVSTLFTLTDLYSAVQMSAIGTDGLLAPPTPLGGSAGQGFRDMTEFGTGSDQVFVATHHGSGQLTSFTISASGQMQVSGTLSSPNQDADSAAIAGATLDGQPIVLVASASNDSLTSYTLSTDGTFEQADTRGPLDGLGVNGPAALKIVTLGADTYAILAATQTSSLTVVRLADDGQLTVTDHINDNRYTRFEGLQDVATLEADGNVFVLAGGIDDGLTLLMLLPDGTLQHLADIAQTQINHLADIAGVSMAWDGDQLSLFAHTQGDSSFSVLTYDISAVGQTLEAGPNGGALSAGSLDDILLDGAGVDTLTGGNGADIFALMADGEADTITDFQIGVETLDLSRWSLVYSLDALQFTPLSNGVRITFGAETLTLLSHDASPLSQQDFVTEEVFTLSRTAPDLHTGDNTAAISGIILGTEGDDILEGTTGDDDIRGLSGNDVFLFSGGEDRIDGGDGVDEISFYNSSQGVTFDLSAPALYSGTTVINLENLGGSDFGDQLTGDAGANQIIGWGGGDILFGLAGDDVLAGGDGDDWLNGGLGMDTLAGGDGIDTADYAQAQQGVRVDPRHLHLNLGEATGDRYIAVENFSGGAFADNLRGTTGNNVIHGLDGDDWLFGRWGADTLYGGDGDDVLMGGAAADAHYGGDGRDRADYRESAVGIRVDLMTPSMSTGIAMGDTFDSIEDLAGGYESDNLRGDHNDNTLIGRSGDDVMFGRNGDDTLIGGDDDDTLYGGQGADTFTFTAGSDRVMDFNLSQGDILQIVADFLDGRDLSSFGQVVDGSALFEFRDGHSLELVGQTNLEVPYEIIN